MTDIEKMRERLDLIVEVSPRTRRFLTEVGVTLGRQADRIGRLEWELGIGEVSGEEPEKVVHTWCVQDGCHNPARARGYCRHHYYDMREINAFGGGKPCTQRGCDLYGVVRGMCRNHYTQARNKGEIETHKKNVPCVNFAVCGRNSYKGEYCGPCSPKEQCLEPGCDRDEYARGYCKKDYQRRRRAGEFKKD